MKKYITTSEIRDFRKRVNKIESVRQRVGFGIKRIPKFERVRRPLKIQNFEIFKSLEITNEKLRRGISFCARERTKQIDYAKRKILESKNVIKKNLPINSRLIKLNGKEFLYG